MRTRREAAIAASSIHENHMYLLLGSPYDLCCTRVAQALRARGHQAEIAANPLTAPARVSWQLDGASINSTFRRAPSDQVPANIEGVLVRSAGWIDPAGWEEHDLSYALAETQAALLAWLWSLRCPVINRYNADLWYRPRPPLAFWRPHLERSGLRTPSMLISNVADDTRAFADQAAREGAPGVVYTTLTSGATYLVGTENDWRGVHAVQERTPVCLTVPHAEPHLATVVGDHVVWHTRPSRAARRLEESLRQFARDARLTFVEVALADTVEGISAVAIDHQPLIDRLTPASQVAIVDAIVGELMASGVAGTPRFDLFAMHGRAS